MAGVKPIFAPFFLVGAPCSPKTIPFPNRSSHFGVHPGFGSLGSFYFAYMSSGAADQRAVEESNPFLDGSFLADGVLQILDRLTELGPVDILDAPLSLTAADSLMVHFCGYFDADGDVIRAADAICELPHTLFAVCLAA